MDVGSAQTWFVAGSVAFGAAGALHALGALVDAVRPTYFTPIERSAKPAMEATGIELRRMFPGAKTGTPSVWSAWLGFNVSHGLGIAFFAAACLLIASYDFALLDRIEGLRALTIAFPAAFLLVSLRFWFYGPTLLTATTTACFTAAAVLPA